MEKKSSSVVASIFAGGLAGATETLVSYPAEFVKTRRQLQPSSVSTTPPTSLSIIRSTLHGPGIKGIYAGCQTLATSNAFKSGIRFFSFSTSKRKLSQYFSPKSPWLDLTAGLFAGTAESIFVVTPGETLKTRVIHDAASGGKLGQLPLARIVIQTVRQNGVISLWRGFIPVLCKQGTNSAVRFTTFGALKDKLRDLWPKTMSGTTATMIAGAGSGVVTVYASMPFDNVKTRMQSIGNSDRSMMRVAARMLATEGVSAFWKATTPRLVRLTLSSSITFMVYDFVMKVVEGDLVDRTIPSRAGRVAQG